MTVITDRRMTPAEQARFYYEHVSGAHEVAWIQSLCADPVVRHDFTGDQTLSHEEQRQRILSRVGRGLTTRVVHIHGDDAYATVIWEVISPTTSIAGIEVLHIPEGKIVEVWSAKRDLLWP